MTKRSCSKHDNHDWECLDCHAIDRQETCVKKLKAENQRLRERIEIYEEAASLGHGVVLREVGNECA